MKIKKKEKIKESIWGKKNMNKTLKYKMAIYDKREWKEELKKILLMKKGKRSVCKKKKKKKKFKMNENK